MSSEEMYTHGHTEAVLNAHRRRTVANSAAYLAPRLVPGVSVLDVGCGPGTITAEIASLVAPGLVVGLDPSADIVAAAAADFRADNLSFRTGDVYALGELGERFDIVHAHQVLQHVPDPVRALEQMRVACRPGGVVAARDGDYGAFTWWPENAGLHRWREIYSTVARANGGEPDAGRRLVAWAHAAGFTEVQASASVWCHSAPADRAWWAQTWAERITASPLSDRALELGIATADELAACADAWRRWSQHPDAWFAVLHGEVVATA